LWPATGSFRPAACHDPPVLDRESLFAHRRGRALWLVLGGGFVLASVWAIRESSPWWTTYAGASPVAAFLDVAAGLGLFAAGALVAHERGPRPFAFVLSLAAISWFSADWVGWEGGHPLVRTLAMAMVPLFPVTVLHLVLAYPGGLREPRSRSTVALAYGVTAVVSVLGVLFRDPLTDSTCWANCTTDVLLQKTSPALGAALSRLDAVITAAIGAATLAAVAWRSLLATAAGRRLTSPVLLPAALVGVTVLLQGLALTIVPRQGPEVTFYATLFQLRAWSVTGLVGGLVWTLVVARRRASAVARLAADVAAAPAVGTFTGRLRAELDDPTLEVAYWVPGAGRFVDEAGAPVAVPSDDPGRIATPITRSGEMIAVMIHDAASVNAAAMQRTVGASTVLALDNQRLRAELLWRLAAVRSSRTRIVAAGDAERARIERNLHDGAQQQLLRVLHEITTARIEAGDSADPELPALLDAASTGTRRLVDEVRELARGIYPAILSELGLREALFALADAAPIAVEIASAPVGPLPAGVERTAYAVVAGALEEAAIARTEALAVHVGVAADMVEITMHVIGQPLTSFEHLADRVAAAGGVLRLEGGDLRASIPCA
jgi:signal transduction histidine kinase